MKWAIELNMFDIIFKPSKAIKGQTLADFIAELTSPTIALIVDPTEGKNHWTLMVNGLSTVNDVGQESFVSLLKRISLNMH